MTDDELDQRLCDQILSQEVDTTRVAAAVRKQIQTQPRHVPGWAVAAAALIVAALMAAFSYQMFRREQTPPLCIAAAQDHQREIVQGDPRRWLSDLSSIESLGLKQGVPAEAILALGTTGYRLERGRLCLLKKQIYLHLVYTRDGRQFSVYLRPRGSESVGNSVREATVGAEDTAYFQSTRLTAVFVAYQYSAAAFARAGAKVL
jgi:hypothetical protein